MPETDSMASSQRHQVSPTSLPHQHVASTPPPPSPTAWGSGIVSVGVVEGIPPSSLTLTTLLSVAIALAMLCVVARRCCKRLRRQERLGGTQLLLHFHQGHRQCLVVELWRTFECPGLLAFSPENRPQNLRVSGVLWPKLKFSCREHCVTFRRTGVKEKVGTVVSLSLIQAFRLRRLLRAGEKELHLHYEWRHHGNAFLVPLGSPAWSRASGNPPIVAM